MLFCRHLKGNSLGQMRYQIGHDIGNSGHVGQGGIIPFIQIQGAIDFNLQGIDVVPGLAIMAGGIAPCIGTVAGHAKTAMA